MSRRLTTEEFIERAKAVHGHRYGYSLVEYVKREQPVEIICTKHGPFRQAAHSHLAGRGCPDCSGRKRLTTEAFIEMAKAIHGDRYDYSQVHYVNRRTHVTIICPDHGPFRQKARVHTYDESGCPRCASKQLTTEAFIERARAVHGDRYDYSQVNYVNLATPVTIICPDHGPFRQTPTNHIYAGSGCHFCADVGFNPNNLGLLYYIAIATDDGDTRYKIGITNRSVADRFQPRDLARIRIIKTWRYVSAYRAVEREAEILRQFAREKYYGPPILASGGNSELFTHDILGLDDQQK